MKIPSAKVIPFPSQNPVTREIEELAFAYWEERFGIRDGSPREDLIRAQIEVCREMRREGLFLVPQQWKPDSTEPDCGSAPTLTEDKRKNRRRPRPSMIVSKWCSTSSEPAPKRPA